MENRHFVIYGANYAGAKRRVIQLAFSCGVAASIVQTVDTCQKKCIFAEVTGAGSAIHKLKYSIMKNVPGADVCENSAYVSMATITGKTIHATGTVLLCLILLWFN